MVAAAIDLILLIAEAEANSTRKREDPLLARPIALASLAGGLTLLASLAAADEVGSFTNDWTGNGIVVEAIADPKVAGITCHIAQFRARRARQADQGQLVRGPVQRLDRLRARPARS